MDEVASATVRRLSVDAVQRKQSMRTFAPLEDFEGQLGFTPAGIAEAAPEMLAVGAAA